MRTLRKAAAADREWVLALRNDPTVMAVGRGRKGTPRWWSNVRRYIWVVEHDLKPVGYMILKPVHEVSIAIEPEHRGQGHAHWALEQTHGIALIDPDNKPSVKAFEGAGYQAEHRNSRALLAFIR